MENGGQYSRVFGFSNLYVCARIYKESFSESFMLTTPFEYEALAFQFCAIMSNNLTG